MQEAKRWRLSGRTDDGETFEYYFRETPQDSMGFNRPDRLRKISKHKLDTYGVQIGDTLYPPHRIAGYEYQELSEAEWSDLERSKS